MSSRLSQFVIGISRPTSGRTFAAPHQRGRRRVLAYRTFAPGPRRHAPTAPLDRSSDQGRPIYRQAPNGLCRLRSARRSPGQSAASFPAPPFRPRWQPARRGRRKRSGPHEPTPRKAPPGEPGETPRTVALSSHAEAQPCAPHPIRPAVVSTSSARPLAAANIALETRQRIIAAFVPAVSRNREQ